MNDRGFTLIEVVVATVIAGMVISTAAAIFATSTQAVGKLADAAERSMRESNGRLWLAEAIAGLEVENTAAGEFVGTSTRLSFPSHVLVPLGWVEPALVSVEFDAGRIAMSALGSTVVVAESLRMAEFDYLLDYGGDSPWVPEWRSRATPPVAVRLQLERAGSPPDTILFFVGKGR